MKQDTAIRITVMILGLFIMSLGIAVSTKAGLGTTPISCVPYVLSQGFPLSFGTFTFLMNCLFVVFQYFLLKEKFETYQWLQIPLIFVFSIFTDLAMILVGDLVITGYVFQWIFCLMSCVLVAFGIALLLKANLLMMAGDALVRALSLVSKIQFGYTKVGFDSTMVMTAVVISWILFADLVGVREGTIVAAVLVGLIVKFFIPKLGCLDRIFTEKTC
ncbi:MAG: DUF6198 family protein [Methanocorpusculum sp.]|uniref:YczE/YyaS/YitT family protein n=1 Tax=Methanocorpusculum sp. TaxID=2058474 RepID=UPI00271E2C68|nr:DUF6198 family protein [Methanocorpusculum sp.]MDO9522370.1 DUF6198 family protein [Methanocorpusculum sp.]